MSTTLSNVTARLHKKYVNIGTYNINLEAWSKSLKLKNGSINGSAIKPKTYVHWIKNIFFDSTLQLCEFLNKLNIPIAKNGINIILEIDVSRLRDTK